MGREEVIELDSDTYICFFCTLRCNFSKVCKYCIQRQDKCLVRRVELPASRFIEYAKQIPKVVRLSLIHI